MTESREPELRADSVAPSIDVELPAPKAEPRAPEGSPASGLSGSPPVAGSATSAVSASPGSVPVASTQTNEAERPVASLPVQSTATKPVGTVTTEPATSTDVVVVGAGIAGLAAAVAA
ncbi:MAG: hypothetical protein HY329_01290, partial [Chloroflexi bacterium]|nr:hypothetical protein [Chloroflexota bacterium]